MSEKFVASLFVLGLRSGPLRADMMFAYGLEKFNSLSELKLNTSRSSLSRLPSGTQKLDAEKPSTYVSPKAALYRKSTWRGRDKP
jgi:hypothetical protein